ncbi:MAG: hypothetical protein PHC84_03145 [Clostridia bacterium]|nr:hypothetical protein [Clostridia bacterium]
MNKFDIYVINITVFVLLLVWTNYFIKSFAEAVFVTLLIFITLRTVFVHLKNRYSDKKNISVAEMSQSFAIMGAEDVCKHLAATLPESYNAVIENNCIIFCKDGKRLLVSPNFKMSALSADEVAKIWRFAKEKAIETVYILARIHQRSVILFANSLEGGFIFPTAKKLHKYLVTHNAMPQKNFHLKKNKASISFRDALSNLFVRKRAKLFLFSGTTLALLAFFSPLTVYYLIMSSVSFGMGIACFAINN